MQRLGGAFFSEVIGEAAAQLTGVVADDVVLNGAVAGGAVEDAHADRVLGDALGAALKTFRHDVEQELRQQRRADEVAAGDDAMSELPARVGFEQASFDETGFVRFDVEGLRRQVSHLALDDGCMSHRFVTPWPVVPRAGGAMDEGRTRR